MEYELKVIYPKTKSDESAEMKSINLQSGLLNDLRANKTWVVLLIFLDKFHANVLIRSQKDKCIYSNRQKFLLQIHFKHNVT
jgi:hypothetical protein